jgi:ribonuclease P protein component
LHPGEAGFPRAARLLTPGDYAEVFAQPQKSADACFTVLCRRRADGAGRLGLAISRKALKRAVDRNRIKRIVRESFRLRRRELAGLDLVVMARKGLPVADGEALRGSLERHWGRLIRRCSLPAPDAPAAAVPAVD